MIVDFVITKSISTFTIWISAFIYIILSEPIINNYGKEYSWSIRYLLSANNVVLLTYLMTRPTLKYFKSNFEHASKCVNPRLFSFIIILMYLVYIIQTYNHVLTNYEGARQLGNAVGGGSLQGAFVKTFGQVLPVLIGYYIVRVKHASKWFALTLCIPIFFFLLVLGTRFRLLFSIAPFFLVTDFIRLKKINKKSLFFMIAFGVGLVIFTNTMKEKRNSSFAEVINSVSLINNSQESSNQSLSVKICSNCSPEGIVEMTRLANIYFQTHDLKYGECSGMLFYFWIPRNIWKEKPTQLDYWMPRYFNPDLSTTFSSASGFTGEVRADFGLLSYLFMVLFGFLLRKVNTMLFLSDYGRKPSYSTLYVSLLIPYLFFFVRSPLTSSYSLIFEFVTIYIIGRFCFSKS